MSIRQDQLLPKKRFAFSSRRKEATNKPNEDVKVQSAASKPKRKQARVEVLSKEISDKRGVKLEIQVGTYNYYSTHTAH